MAQSQVSEGTSTSLIGRVKRRDADAWSVMARLYGPLVYGWARQCGLQDQDAADVVQEVFQSVARAIDGFDHDGDGSTFRGWLWTIARNAVRQQARRRARQPEALGGTDANNRWREVPEIAENATDPSGTNVQAMLAHRAIRIIQQEFEPRTWEAFWRTTVDGQSAAEIANELGMTPQAIRQAKYRVLCRLREVLG